MTKNERYEMNEEMQSQVDGGRFYNPGHLGKVVPNNFFRTVLQSLGKEEEKAPGKGNNRMEYGKIDPEDQDTSAKNAIETYHSNLV